MTDQSNFQPPSDTQNLILFRISNLETDTAQIKSDIRELRDFKNKTHGMAISSGVIGGLISGLGVLVSGLGITTVGAMVGWW